MLRSIQEQKSVRFVYKVASKDTNENHRSKDEDIFIGKYARDVGDVPVMSTGVFGNICCFAAEVANVGIV